MIGEVLGRRPRVEYAPTMLGDVQDTSADTWTARKLLGFAPSVDLRAGLAAEVEWIQDHFYAMEAAGGATVGFAP
jgi:nucleoside-diphosphate-sugar epimerase